MRKKYELIKETKGTALLEYVGIWYKRGLDALGDKRPVLLRVPKKSDWAHIMDEFHTERGHPGRDGTMGLLTQHFYFPRMREAVVSHISNCMCDGKKSSKKTYFQILRPKLDVFHYSQSHLKQELSGCYLIILT